MIYILSGPTGTGKTTRLLQWCADRKNIDGILAPVIDNKRYLFHIAGNIYKPLQADQSTPDEDKVNIGRFVFDNTVFNWARNILDNCDTGQLSWLIVDEIGPLELEGQGLEPAVQRLIDRNRNMHRVNLLLVVRENLVDRVCSRYQIQAEKFRFGLE